MAQSDDCNPKELNSGKETITVSVEGESPIEELPHKEKGSRLSAKNKRNYPAKHCLWVDFKAVKLDGRTALAKAINLMRRELIKHVGGKPSIAQALLIERVVHKAMKAFIYETNFFLDQKQGSEDHYLALVNSLRLDLQALGLQRSGGKVGDLAEYLNKKTEKFGRHEEND